MPKLLMLVLSWSRAGGLEAVTVEIAKTFCGFGWCVDVLSIYDADVRTVEGISSIPLSPRGKIPRSLHHRGLWRYRLRSRLVQIWKRYDLIIIGHVNILPGCSPFLTSSSGTLIWLWTYGLEVWGDIAREYLPYLSKLSRVVSISHFTRSRIQEAGTTVPITVIPPFVDEEKFVPVDDIWHIRRDEILICGRMSKTERYKGHDILFKSLRKAEELCGFPLRISVVGGGDDQPRLEALVRELGITKSVTFRGHLSFSDLVDAYQHCGVFVMPSVVIRRVNDYWSGEGFGIVYIEAAACGRPVIASQDGGAPETIIPGETGLLVDPHSVDSVANAIATVLRQPALADEMGRRGRKMVEDQFSRNVFEKNIQRVIENDISVAQSR